ncbi:MAG: 50S ribosomal protein L25 [Candidatus Daviesbacteria bacterium]|nr:50S ribosomal protein L25 [Candidatus Daviesbacteria bacterium]
MDRLSLQAEERIILGKKVKNLRKDGKLPGHVFGKGLETEHVSVDGKTFLKTFKEAGETGLIDLKIGTEKVRPVMIKGVQYNPVSGQPIHIDFYQVNMSEKVKVPVPLVLIGDEPESVKLGETIVLQTLNEIEVEALPADLIEKIEVDITPLKNIDDTITVGQLNFDRSKLTVSAPEEEIVVKLAPAITEEMKKQMEEETAAAAAAVAEAVPPVEGAAAEGAEGEQPQGEAASAESSGEPKEAPKE